MNTLALLLEELKLLVVACLTCHSVVIFEGWLLLVRARVTCDHLCVSVIVFVLFVGLTCITSNNDSRQTKLSFQVSINIKIGYINQVVETPRVRQMPITYPLFWFKQPRVFELPYGYQKFQKRSI